MPVQRKSHHLTRQKQDHQLKPKLNSMLTEMTQLKNCLGFPTTPTHQMACFFPCRASNTDGIGHKTLLDF